MKNRLINSIKTKMKPFLNENDINLTISESIENQELLNNFLSSKKVEGCSERTIDYYNSTILKMLDCVNQKIENIT